MLSLDFDSALIVSPSKVMQDLIGRFLRGRAQKVLGAGSTADAVHQVAMLGASDLVVLDVDTDGQENLALLEDFATEEHPNRPAFVVVVGKSDLETETRASLLGAIGLLTKPVSLPRFSAILRSSLTGFQPAAQRLRAKPLGEVILLDEPMGSSVATWTIEDISESGAFVNSHVAYEPGTILPMELHLGSSRVSVTARVVRADRAPVPSIVGIGVQFELDPETRTSLQRSLTQLAASGRVDLA